MLLKRHRWLRRKFPTAGFAKSFQKLTGAYRTGNFDLFLKIPCVTIYSSGLPPHLGLHTIHTVRADGS
ncbi:hypothetical protein M378DRAFT_160547 [Amanita muscaria Koide BX008]|uniref:Uncharacterized protein n=1 Tax=Amanita muscaria (strain Koide BX008) TaxID=946122 RepID=A0A0C2THY6_AMAMK|nr:hypothetical protein M378DRAFT_160547 [Amanita muscaria Koide BX008]